MKEMTLVFRDVECMDFGAGITTHEELHQNVFDQSLCFGAYDAAHDYVFGPQLNGYLMEEALCCEFDGQKYEVPVSDIPVFNSNKEIMSSDFFTPEQAEFVKEKVKSAISTYYKTWNTGYRSEEKSLIEVEEAGNGEIYAELEIDGPFNSTNLFFIQSDTLPFKESSIIATVGYKNPDGSISYGSFEKDDYESDGVAIKFENCEYDWDEFEAEFS